MRMQKEVLEMLEMECLTVNNTEVAVMCDPDPGCPPDYPESCAPDRACLPTDI